MDLLTESQRRLVFEFKEKVRELESKQKTNLSYKDPTLNLNVSETNLLKDIPQKNSETKLQRNEFLTNYLMNQKSPEKEINPNQLLKTVIFNATPKEPTFTGIRELSPNKFKSTSHYPISSDKKNKFEEQGRSFHENKYSYEFSRGDFRSIDKPRQIEEKENLKNYFTSPHSAIEKSAETAFLTNESYSDKLEQYLRKQEEKARQLKNINSFSVNDTSLPGKSRLTVPSIKAFENNSDKLGLYSKTHDDRYKPFFSDNADDDYKLHAPSSTKSQQILAKPKPMLYNDDYQLSRKGSQAPLNSRPRVTSATKRKSQSASRKRAASAGKKVTFIDDKALSKGSAKKTPGTKKEETEQKKLTDEIIRRLRLGILDTRRFAEIFEDQLYFSTRFLENVRALIKK